VASIKGGCIAKEGVRMGLFDAIKKCRCKVCNREMTRKEANPKKELERCIFVSFV